MEWLAIKHYEYDLIFTQSRESRDIVLSYYVKNGITINTVVLRVFNSEEEATKYCNNINQITNLIKNL
jgi:hypothetical protein